MPPHLSLPLIFVAILQKWRSRGGQVLWVTDPIAVHFVCDRSQEVLRLQGSTQDVNTHDAEQNTIPWTWIHLPVLPLVTQAPCWDAFYDAV